MINEVYLMSSLPALSFGQAPPIALEEFEDMAKNELPRGKYSLLQEVDIRTIDGSCKRPVAMKVYSLLGDLQQEIVNIRQAWHDGYQDKIDLLPKSIAKANPLEREIQIMQWLWEQLDDLEEGKTFTMTEVAVYKLKLQMLYRLDSFNAERGATKMASVLNQEQKTEEQENNTDEQVQKTEDQK